MAKSQKFICQSCGTIHQKWAGRCDQCGEWNTIVEEETQTHSKSLGAKKGRIIELGALEGEDKPIVRNLSKNVELDRVLGGGFVPGSAILVGGDPGIGKSTLLLQASAALSENNYKTIYISGEEAAAQIRMRADRLGLRKAPVLLASATNLRNILETISAEKPQFVIIDSIQTIWSDQIDSAPGTVTQVRAIVHELVNYAKRANTTIILVGHVTKEGQIAGPRIVEHMVDTVLYFEGERGHDYRLLRAVKNRFGPAGEIGVFEMTSQGLSPVANPSALFLADREVDAAGSAVFAGMEGSRPLLCEIQALIAPTPFSTPRRAVLGWDSARLSMLLAVLEARAGLEFGPSDIYLNVAGGLKITETAADLAVAAALLSAHFNRPLPRGAIFFGEVSLSGALRGVPFAEQRINEAKKLGFSKAITPKQIKLSSDSPLELSRYSRLEEVVEIAGHRG